MTLIGVFVNPTLIVEKKRKSDIEKEVELLGLKVVDVLCKNRFRLGWVFFSEPLPGDPQGLQVGWLV